jgi:hypothetical protein
VNHSVLDIYFGEPILIAAFCKRMSGFSLLAMGNGQYFPRLLRSVCDRPLQTGLSECIGLKCEWRFMMGF